MSVMTLVWVGGLALLLGVVLVVLPALVPVRAERMNGLELGLAVGTHAADETGEWRPCHRHPETGSAGPYNGRHYAGARCWSGNLIEDTTMVTTGELAHMLLAA